MPFWAGRTEPYSQARRAIRPADPHLACRARDRRPRHGLRRRSDDGSRGFHPEHGRAFDEPEVLRSQRGRLTTTFRVQEGPFKVGGVSVRGKSYQGTFIGPTLRVRPGDSIEVRVMNRLGEPTNLHEHGFHVSPVGVSDNILRTMPARSRRAVRVHIPRDMAPGTYWYHSHLHPLVEEQVFSGSGRRDRRGGPDRASSAPLCAGSPTGCWLSRICRSATARSSTRTSTPGRRPHARSTASWIRCCGRGPTRRSCCASPTSAPTSGTASASTAYASPSSPRTPTRSAWPMDGR